mgnify:CR=1 FL=1
MFQVLYTLNIYSGMFIVLPILTQKSNSNAKIDKSINFRLCIHHLVYNVQAFNFEYNLVKRKKT